MGPWVAFLRGINVGGNNVIPMRDLTDLLTESGFYDVKTYIQSGNVVFRSGKSDASRLEQELRQLLAARFSCSPDVYVLSAKQLANVVANNPYKGIVGNPSRLLLYFLAAPSEQVDYDSMDARKSPTESYALDGQVLYLHAPDGIGRSKLAASIERCVGQRTTARNLRTVSKVLAMAEHQH